MQSINIGQNNSTQEMVFEKNSLVLVDYTVRLRDSNVTIKTTRAADAPRPRDPKVKYKPELVSIGNPAHKVKPGFDAALMDAQINVPQSVEVKPQDAYGEVNRSQIRMFTIRKLGESADKVSVGDTIKVDGRQGTIKFIGSGRVRIDFNHKHAGKTLLYDFVVTKKLETPTEIIEAVLDSSGFLEDENSYALEDDFLSIMVPSKWLRSKETQSKKFFLQLEMFQFVPELEGIEFIEIYRNPAKPEPDPQSEY